MSTPHYEIKLHNFNPEIIPQLYDYYFAEEFWPIIYLLKERKKKTGNAYIGETFDIITRLTSHLNHPDKNKLQEVYLISDKKFNKSVTLDIEANLIKYISGDGQYKLLNANLGLADHSYYQKEELYDEIFRSIWEDLRSLGIVKKSLVDIDNSDLFKYSPYKALSVEQTKSLIMILESLLDDRYESFVIEGGAGSGKTVLAVFLFKLLNTSEDDFNFGAFGQEDKRIVELVRSVKDIYPNPKMALIIPIDSFRSTVQKIFRHVKGLSADMVVGPAELDKNYYDIAMVDEAHRLRQRIALGSYFGRFDEVCETLKLDRATANELDWVRKKSGKRILFYDEYQSIRPSDVPVEAFDILKNEEDTKTQYLNSQFRVKGGLKYVKFIDRLLKCNLKIDEKIELRKYNFLLFYDLKQMLDLIKEKDKKEQLARVVAGYAWPWPSKKNKGAFDIKVDDLQLRWNSVFKNWINSANAINEVGCIHTVQGYDLNYTGIIFGNEIGYDKKKNEIIIRKDKYYDRNGKISIKSPEQLKGFILNIYKTLMLRGIKGTYIYICDESLREYFADHIPIYNNFSTNYSISKEQVLPFVNSVPLFDLKAAAGYFSEQQQISDYAEWISVPDSFRISKNHFACKVIGESMNRVISNGAVCLFRKDEGGTRNGKIVLVSYTSIQDADFGSNYTVKKYFSEKKYNPDGTWEHERIILKPLSTDPSYTDVVITLKHDELSSVKVVGIFESVLSV